MNLNVRGIRYQISDETREFLDKKLAKLDFAESYLHDLDITMKRETLGQGFHIDAKLHFSWGTVKVVSYDCYELYEGIEMIAEIIAENGALSDQKISDLLLSRGVKCARRTVSKYRGELNIDSSYAR